MLALTGQRARGSPGIRPRSGGSSAECPVRQLRAECRVSTRPGRPDKHSTSAGILPSGWIVDIPRGDLLNNLVDVVASFLPNHPTQLSLQRFN